MTYEKRFLFAGALALPLAMAGCGDSKEAGIAIVEASPEALQAIKERQEGFKTMGGAFKNINDELKTGNPDAGAILGMAREIQVASEGQVARFIPDSGPETGVKMRARAEIWESMPDFEAKYDAFVAASDRLAEVSATGDVAAITAQAKNLGATCKACHDKFRVAD